MVYRRSGDQRGAEFENDGHLRDFCFYQTGSIGFGTIISAGLMLAAFDIRLRQG